MLGSARAARFLLLHRDASRVVFERAAVGLAGRGFRAARRSRLRSQHADRLDGLADGSVFAARDVEHSIVLAANAVWAREFSRDVCLERSQRVSGDRERVHDIRAQPATFFGARGDRSSVDLTRHVSVACRASGIRIWVWVRRDAFGGESVTALRSGVCGFRQASGLSGSHDAQLFGFGVRDCADHRQRLGFRQAVDDGGRRERDARQRGNGCALSIYASRARERARR